MTPISYSNSIVLNTTRQLYIHIPVLHLSLNDRFNTGVYRYMVSDNCNKYPTQYTQYQTILGLGKLEINGHLI